jgi:hypothetical protein
LDPNHKIYLSSERPGELPNLVVENVHSFHRTSLDLNWKDIPPGRFIFQASILRNTMPYAWSNGHTPGYFRADLSERLIVLDFAIYWRRSTNRNRKQTIHISSNALLLYVLLHSPGGPIPWEAWTPGIVRQIPDHEIVYQTIARVRPVCGMRALNHNIVKDRLSRPVIRIYDYHPQRVRYARSRLRPQPSNHDAPNVLEQWSTTQHPSLRDRPELAAPGGLSYILPGGEKELSCLVKEIPIPNALLVGTLMCVLGEDVVVLAEVSEQY